MVQWWCWRGSVGNPPRQLGWEELRLRRARIKTILLFKIVNNLVDIPPEPFLIPTGGRRW
jgi:hypothetical protein